MSVSFSRNPAIVPGSRRIAMASLLEHGTDSAPEYVVLAGLDRHHPLVARDIFTGSLIGNGKIFEIITPGSDAFGYGMVFTHTVKGFYNGTYGYLHELIFTPSCGNFRSEYLSLYGFGQAGQPDVKLRSQLAAEVACPLFDAGVFGIPELYPDAVHLGTLDLVTWAVFAAPEPGAAASAPDSKVAMLSSARHDAARPTAFRLISRDRQVA